MIEIQTDDILILANNKFSRKEKTAIKITKIIITQDQKHLTFSYTVKFYKTKIKLNLEKIVLTKNNYVSSIFLLQIKMLILLVKEEILGKSYYQKSNTEYKEQKMSILLL